MVSRSKLCGVSHDWMVSATVASLAKNAACSSLSNKNGNQKVPKRGSNSYKSVAEQI